MGDDALIGPGNVVSSHPVYVHLYRDGGALDLGDHAKITSWHKFDSAGSVTIGEFSSVAGTGTTVLTHGIDFDQRAAAYPVVIGHRSFVGGHCLIVGGAVLPER
jgi:acetyltransferase-like isoleucine patch superfamily enzyme